MADSQDMDQDDDTDAGVELAPSVDGPSAAAILLMLLNDDTAAAILRGLEPDEVRLLGKAMYSAADASEAKIEAALDKFITRNRSIATLSIGADPRIRNVITQALGNVRADNILAEIAPQSSTNALDILRWMPAKMIQRILSDEHPQVGALVLAVLTPEVASSALRGLDEAVQSDLVYRAARLASVNGDAIGDLETLLTRYTGMTDEKPRMRVGGKNDAAKIVNSMSKSNGERVLKSVKKRDKILGQQIEDEMFIFENLLELDTKSLGALLRTVDSTVLTLALKGASAELVEKSLGCMSARAAQSIRDDMTDSGPTKRTEVDEAQKTMIIAVRQLAADGTIMLGSGGDDYV